MIQMHNEVVQENDYVLIVGDLTLSKNENDVKEIINSLNGKKILIRGNHDVLKDSFYLDNGFLDVKEFLIVNDTFICHYPCYVSQWNRKREPWLINQLKKNSECNRIIHGHIHNKDPGLWEPDGYSRTNVCVDYTPNEFKPLEMSQEITDYIIEKY